jgi:molybdopterin-guanine dinucleotide biosynthesis protein A
VNGLVLAGGQSSRMGADKALIDYHGLPQYLYIYKLLENFCDRVFISSKEEIYPLPTIIDLPEYAHLGPIAGILSAFQMEETDWLVLAIDYPLITEIEVSKLTEPSNELAHVYFNPETGFFEPFLAFYKKEFKSILDEELKYGSNSLQTILRKGFVHKVVPENLDLIRSVDYPKVK